MCQSIIKHSKRWQQPTCFCQLLLPTPPYSQASETLLSHSCATLPGSALFQVPSAQVIVQECLALLNHKVKHGQGGAPNGFPVVLPVLVGAVRPNSSTAHDKMLGRQGTYSAAFVASETIPRQLACGPCWFCGWFVVTTTIVAHTAAWSGARTGQKCGGVRGREGKSG